jgi:hypothetical protein
MACHADLFSLHDRGHKIGDDGFVHVVGRVRRASVNLRLAPTSCRVRCYVLVSSRRSSQTPLAHRTMHDSTTAAVYELRPSSTRKVKIAR